MEENDCIMRGIFFLIEEKYGYSIINSYVGGNYSLRNRFIGFRYIVRYGKI